MLILYILSISYFYGQWPAKIVLGKRKAATAAVVLLCLRWFIASGRAKR